MVSRPPGGPAAYGAAPSPKGRGAVPADAEAPAARGSPSPGVASRLCPERGGASLSPSMAVPESTGRGGGPAGRAASQPGAAVRCVAPRGAAQGSSWGRASWCSSHRGRLPSSRGRPTAKACGGELPRVQRKVMDGKHCQEAAKPLGRSTMSPGRNMSRRWKSHAPVGVTTALPART